MEFLNEVLTTLESNKETILTYLGVGGTSGGIATGAVLYIKSKANALVERFKSENSLLKNELNTMKAEMDELKKGNRIMSEYVELSSELKAKSSVVDDELKSKFNEISLQAQEHKDNIVTQFKDKAKQVLQDTLDKY